MGERCAFCTRDQSVPRMVFFSGATAGILICRFCVEHAVGVLAEFLPAPAPARRDLDDTTTRGALLELYEIADVRRG